MDDSERFEIVEEVRVDAVKANLLAGVMMVPLMAFFAGVAWLLPFYYPDLWVAWVTLAGFLPIIVLHEGLHAYAAWRYAGVPRSKMRFGFNWKAAMAYFHTPVPMAVDDYRKVIFLPFLITSPLALLLVVLVPTFPMAVLAAMIVSSCAGDLMMDHHLRRFRGRGLYILDHPTECGFSVGKTYQPE